LAGTIGSIASRRPIVSCAQVAQTSDGDIGTTRREAARHAERRCRREARGARP
jgi:hypothetical protein